MLGIESWMVKSAVLIGCLYLLCAALVYACTRAEEESL